MAIWGNHKDAKIVSIEKVVEKNTGNTWNQDKSPLERATEQRFIETLERHHFHTMFQSIGGKECLMVSVRWDAVFDIYFLFEKDCSALLALCMPFITFPRMKRKKVVECVNKLNKDFGFQLFDVGASDVCMCLAKDIDPTSPDVGDDCYRVFNDCVNICIDYHSKLMNALWG